jgi:hypothetical protein
MLGDPNILQKLGFQEGDIIEIEPFHGNVIPAKNATIEFSTYDSNQDEFFRDQNIKRLEKFLKSYYLTEITELFWPDFNANLRITINHSIPKENEIYHLNEACNVTLREQMKSMPFNAILLIDKSKSMTNKDVNLDGVSDVISDLKNTLFESGQNRSFSELYELVEELRTSKSDRKEIIREDRHGNLKKRIKVTGARRLDSVLLATLLFFQLKISRGFGEKCAFVIYADEAKPISFKDHNSRSEKNYIEATEFNTEICNLLVRKIKDSDFMRYGNTNISSAIQYCKNIAHDFKFAENSNNPLMILLLTDGRPHPKEIDNQKRLIETIYSLKDYLKKYDIPFIIYTLGIGRERTMRRAESLLTRVAKAGNGEYHYVSNLKKLIEWYQDLADNFAYKIKFDAKEE